MSSPKAFAGWGGAALRHKAAEGRKRGRRRRSAAGMMEEAAEEEEEEEEEAAAGAGGGVDGGRKAREGLRMAAATRRRGRRKQDRLITMAVAWGLAVLSVGMGKGRTTMSRVRRFEEGGSGEGGRRLLLRDHSATFTMLDNEHDKPLAYRWMPCLVLLLGAVAASSS